MKKIEKFDFLYNDLYQKNIKELNKLKSNLKLAKVGITISITGLILTFLAMMPFYNVYLLLAFIIFILILGLSLILYNKDKKMKNAGLDYAGYYKINIIKPLFCTLFDNVEYNLKGNLESEEYKKCEWGNYNYYSSKDLISATLNNYKLKLSSVYTSWDSGGDLNNTHHEFIGLFGIINFNKKNTKEFKIKHIGRLEKCDDNFYSYYKTDVDLDDLLKQFLLKVAKESKYSVDLFSTDNKMYFRIFGLDLFEPSIFGRPLDKRKIEELYELIILIKNIVEITINNLEKE